MHSFIFPFWRTNPKLHLSIMIFNILFDQTRVTLTVTTGFIEKCLMAVNFSAQCSVISIQWHFHVAVGYKVL